MIISYYPPSPHPLPTPPQTVFRVTQTTQDASHPPRHIIVSVQIPQNRAFIECHSIERNGTSRLKQYPMLLAVSSDDLAWLRVTQTPPRHLPDTSRHPQIYQCWRCECQEFLTAQTQLREAVMYMICFPIVIPSTQSWQHPGSIRRHTETLQTPPGKMQSPQY